VHLVDTGRADRIAEPPRRQCKPRYSNDASEALQCLGERVVRSARDADTGSVLGIGFPARTGGVVSFIDAVAGGPNEFTRRARDLARRYGDRFVPPELAALKARIGDET
jgi:hypothetical protein